MQDNTTKEPLSIAEMDKEFIKSLTAHLYSAPKERYQLKKAFGRDIKDDISTYMAFLKVSGENIFKPKEDIYFLVACLFYLMENPDMQDQDRKRVSFGTLLGRIYGTSDSTDNKISYLVNSDYDAKGIFQRQFVSYAKRCKSELRSGEMLDYYTLLQDLKFWNMKDKKAKMKWAREITNKTKAKNKED